MKKVYFVLILLVVLLFSSCEGLSNSFKSKSPSKEDGKVNMDSLSINLNVIKYDNEENENNFEEFEYNLQLKSIGEDNIKIKKEDLTFYEISNEENLQRENIEEFKKKFFGGSEFKFITKGLFKISGTYKVKKKQTDYIFRLKTSYEEENVFKDRVFLTDNNKVNIELRTQFSPIQILEYKIREVNENKKLDIILQNKNSDPAESFENFDISINFRNINDLSCNEYFTKKEEVYVPLENKEELKMGSENREVKIRCDLSDNYESGISTNIGGIIKFNHVIDRSVRVY